MNWMVLLPIIVSVGLTAAVFITIYRIPPRWVTAQTDRLDAFITRLDSITSPQFVGDAIHHAVMKNDAELLAVAGSEANGIVHEAMPVFTEHLAKEAVQTLGAMYQSGYASKIRGESGGAKGYLSLPGFSKHAAKAGVEGLAGGALGGLLDDIPPEVIQGFMSSLLTPGAKDNGPKGLPAGSPQAANQTPMLGSPV